MNLPICSNLKDGVKFDFDTLANSFDAVEEFWNWWWEKFRDTTTIIRPETIEDSEAILEPTENKQKVDLVAYSEFFHEFLIQAIESRRITAAPDLPRQFFGEQVSKIVGSNSIKLPGKPQIVFAGGGYGSGKTTTVSYMASCGQIPLKMQHMIGVDYFKFFVPEYNLIQTVADGRASLTVQSECKTLAANLCNQLVNQKRSFIWDSSMSDEIETIDRIKLAHANDYELSMIAIFTPIEIAIKQAMQRAKQSRRFPHPEALPRSHHGFRKAFLGYVPHFRNITVFAKVGNPDDVPVVVAEKKDGKELAIYNDELLKESLTVQVH